MEVDPSDSSIEDGGVSASSNEHLIQASDVSHTMQHWHAFLKWKERLLREMYAVYKDGRAEKGTFLLCPFALWQTLNKRFLTPLACLHFNQCT